MMKKSRGRRGSMTRKALALLLAALLAATTLTGCNDPEETTVYRFVYSAP